MNKILNKKNLIFFIFHDQWWKFKVEFIVQFKKMYLGIYNIKQTHGGVCGSKHMVVYKGVSI